MQKLYRYLVYFVRVTGLLCFSVVAYLFIQIYRSESKLDSVPLLPANYEPAAQELVKLCQSDPSFFSKEDVSYLDPFDPVWAPPSVAKLHPEVIDVAADHATVNWGGGFYHCGWDLFRGPPSADGRGYYWILSFTTDGHQKKELKGLTVGTDVRLTEDEFIRQVLQEFDRRLASQADDGISTNESSWYLAAGRCVFLAKHHRVDLLPAQVRKAAANYPHDWRDVLLGYLLDHAAGDAAAGDRLQQWADRTSGPAAWMYAAYAFYQAGDIDAGNASVKNALTATAQDPEWIDNDAPSYELAMAVRLYNSGNFPACVIFSDGILASLHRYFTTRSSVQNVRDAAASTAASRPAKLPEFDKFTLVDPFGGFDLTLLNSGRSSSHFSATQP